MPNVEFSLIVNTGENYEKSTFYRQSDPCHFKTMLKALDRHGVNSHTLFPDLEGLCKYLNWKHENS
ncbi:hypothetical protein P20495_2989 [Pseudoalteromonas sp. BSi20495]|nr:hypothetical protein P20495_2989 [Pseudoalteromonas sp. BSi20495]